jgi:hypothetical protein
MQSDERRYVPFATQGVNEPSKRPAEKPVTNAISDVWVARDKWSRVAIRARHVRDSLATRQIRWHIPNDHREKEPASSFAREERSRGPAFGAGTEPRILREVVDVVR